MYQLMPIQRLIHEVLFPLQSRFIDLLAQFCFPTGEIIDEIKRYKSFLQVGNDTATLTPFDIAKSDLKDASLSDALMLTLTTDLRVHSERAKGRFFYVKLAIAYEVAFRYATTDSVDVKAIPGRPSRIKNRLEESAKSVF
jgi:hypothetical protein